MLNEGVYSSMSDKSGLGIKEGRDIVESEGKSADSRGKMGAVLVVGGGIAGIQASLDLAESGFYTYLVELSPAIGGVMAQLDKTFPTNDCSLCILSPKLVECGRHRNIEIITNARMSNIEGEPGDFNVSIVQKPRYVNEDRCVGCGVCAEKCPVKVPDGFNEGLSERKAIYVKYPQAVPLVYMIDAEHCLYFTKGKCRLCERFCESKAIDYEQKEKLITINVGAVILAPGFDEFNAQQMANYGYGLYPNVITSIEFERILSASGPYQGEIIRPSDKTHPKKIAWIQCVGSRDIVCGNGYCSSVCCMYATKEAIIAKEHESKIKPTIFYMDIRAQGKEFDTYYERAKGEHGVRYIRSMISRVSERPKTGNLELTYIDEKGKIKEEEFELVVLSVGLKPSEGALEQAENLGIELNEYGFCATHPFSPLVTSKPGIFVCGPFQSPKDIPETVAQASGAAACSAALLSGARGNLIKKKDYPEEIDISGQVPRIGFFVCHCGINIGGVVNVPEVVEYARDLEGVVFATENLYTCSQDAQEKIKEIIKEHKLNRVVVASCSPRTHEPLFQETIREAGLNKYLFEMANIRDQCSWVHMHNKDEATQKAKDLAKMIVAKSRLLEPLEAPTVDVIKKGLVIGGGLAGMTATLKLAQQGFETFLIEESDTLGGNLRKLYFTITGNDPQELLKNTIKEIEENPLIQVFKNSKVEEISGYVGNFKSRIETLVSSDTKEVEIEHGAIIVATGGEESKPKGEYLYGQDERVITQLELEERLSTPDPQPLKFNSIVMIQCVGSRIAERTYCSRVCCQEAIKNALQIKEKNPDVEIHILYRDMRTYGFTEEYYRKARQKRINFIRYDLENKPEVSVDNASLKVKVTDLSLGRTLVLFPELLVLSSALVSRENEELAKMLKVPLSGDGFFLEAHAKLRPVDFATDGIFLCGMAHFPKTIDETISQAAAASARAAITLSHDVITVTPIVSTVDQENCIGCGLCESLCPYNAIRLEPWPEGGEKAFNISASCKGCGICAANCPQRAIKMNHFNDSQLSAQITALVEA